MSEDQKKQVPQNCLWQKVQTTESKKKWSEKSGDNYKCFMVFETKVVSDTYTAKSIIDEVRML